MRLTPQDILEKGSQCFKKARQDLLEGAALLSVIFREKLYLGQFSTFGEYVEESCQISPSFAAKLIRVHDHYVLENSIGKDRLIGVDMEKLYQATFVEGTAKLQLSQAATLSRSELREQMVTERHPHCEHAETYRITICRSCGARV